MGQDIQIREGVRRIVQELKRGRRVCLIEVRLGVKMLIQSGVCYGVLRYIRNPVYWISNLTVLILYLRWMPYCQP